MDATRLKAMPAPLKNRYREDAGAARVTLWAGRALAVAGLHPATGRAERYCVVFQTLNAKAELSVSARAS